jgi:hypothetical protein
MIYFARLASGAIKIGYSADVETRIIALRSTYAGGQSLLATIEGTRETEREIHQRFAHLRFGRTEQFRPAPELMEFIGQPTVASVEQITPSEVIEHGYPKPLTIRLTAAQRSILDRLAREWSPVAPLSRSQVLVELIRRTVAEVRGKKHSENSTQAY